MKEMQCSRAKVGRAGVGVSGPDLEKVSLPNDCYRNLFGLCHRELVVLSALSTARCIVAVGKLFGLSSSELQAALPVLEICKRDAGVSSAACDTGRKLMQERLVAGLAQAPTYFAEAQQHTPVVARQKAQALVTHLVLCLHNSPENRSAVERLFSRLK